MSTNKMKTIVILLIIGISSAKNSSDQIKYTNTEYSFWKYWKPSYYFLEIATNIEKESFSGEVRITGTILEDTDKLGLHSKVNISDGFYSIKENYTQLDLNLASENYTSGVIVFKLNQIIKKDVEFMLTLKYSGQMQELKGLYMSFYEFNDEKRKVISTEFQPIGARLVFPCIDIPSYKAVFEIKLGRPQSMKALSNMPIRNTSAPDPKINGQVWDTFYPSPKMSTYLVAFVIYDDMSNKKLRKNITIWYPDESKEKMQLAFDNMGVLLEAMENYTGMDYHLSKMDFLVVPRKMSVAMESWGLITWGHQYLSLKSELSSFDDKLKFVLLMAHEIAHQWFGNLVTCKYWCYVWLNEGIATYLMYLIVDMVYPDLKAKEWFLPYNKDYIMSEDSETPSSLVEHRYCRNDIFEYTNTPMQYFKGATIINMVVDVIMNSDSFRQGLQTYLMENQFDSVTEKELWRALQTKINKSSVPEGESLESLMYGWTHNYGFPLMTVYRHKNGSLTVKQEPFDIQRQNKDVKSYWWIPVTYTTSKERDFDNVHLKEWLRPTNEAQPLAVNITDDEWIILNLQNIGYYKVNYDKRTWELITTHLMSDNMAQIHPFNRVQLITDAFSLAKSGILNYSTFLNISRYLQNEFHHIPLDIGLKMAENLILDSEETPVYESLREYFKYIVHNRYKHFTSVNHKAKMMIVKYGCSLDFEHCKNQTKELLDDIINNKIDENQLNSELRYTFWCTASNIGDEKVFNHIKQKYIEEKQSSLKDEYFNALFCVKNKTLFNSFLKDILDKADYLKEKTLTDLLNGILSSDTSCLTIDYFSEKFNLRYGDDALMEHLETLVNIKTLKKNCKDKLKELLVQKSINLTVVAKPPWDEKYVAEISSWFKSTAMNFEIKEDNINISNTNIFIKDNINYLK